MTAGARPPAHPHRRLWLPLLGIGTVVWLVAVVITGLTRDTILVPTVVLLGSFLVPVAMVALALTQVEDTELTVNALLGGFLAAGTLGLLFAALTETYLLPSAYGTFISVGLIEEGTKGAVLLVVARTIRRGRPRDGMILGATVGAGFAAFESAGYALTAVVGHSADHPVLRIVETELSRAVLAPFGHITWTALLGGAVFAGRQVLSTFARIVLLHAAWDATYGWAILITRWLEGDGLDLAWPNTEAWIGTPAGRTLVVFDVVYGAILAINAGLGAAWVVRRWRGYGRQ